MGLDQYAHLRNRKVDWEKYYNDDEEEQKGVFVWRKHARLQFQEESVKEYKNQDKKFIDWCKEQIKNKQVPIYCCSW